MSLLWMPKAATGGGGGSGYLKYRSFDGVDDQVLVSLGDLASTTLRPCTWAFYIRPTALPGSDGGSAVIAATSSYDPFDMFIVNNAGTIRLWFYDGGSNYTPSNSLSDDVWTIIVYRVTGAGVAQISLWKQGTGWSHASTAGTYGSRSWPASGSFYFGISPFPQADYVCAANWDGTVLNDTQVETLEDSFAAWSTLSPSHLWRFDQTPPNDSVGNCDHVSTTGTTVSGTDSPLPES